MDELGNPYRPGAGTRPPALTGRDELLGRFAMLVKRTKLGKPGQSLMPTGLRGVGKTVLLGEFEKIASAQACEVVSLEATEDGRFIATLAARIRSLLLRLDRGPASRMVIRALGALKSFSLTEPSGFKFSLDIEPIAGLADSGILALDLTDLIVATAEAARDRKTAIFIDIDEIQYLRADEFAAVIVAIHRTNQRDLPVILVGAGLPQLPALSGEAKSYAERLFTFPTIDALDATAATAALVEPARDLGVRFTTGAIDRILERSAGYPYFLQEYAYAAWNAAAGPDVIDESAVEAAEQIVTEKLDANFFSVRIESLTSAQERYVAAMASLGDGPYATSEIAKESGTNLAGTSRTRESLINKGVIFSPTYGSVAFTVPLFADFLRRRIMTRSATQDRLRDEAGFTAEADGSNSSRTLGT